MPTNPPDAATLARVKAVVTRLVAEPWTWKPAPCGCCGEEEIDHIGPIRSGAHDIALDGNVTPDEIVALVNAAQALVAGCETLLRVKALICDLMREARRLRDAGVEDDTNDRWIAAGERENLACRLRNLLAALDAAREEP